uniref:C3H1-type domain-containing protein n=2 Tax=Macrostomum lignano TaxID=282301 RepID=A0A1I8ISA0_9PLAT
MGGLLLQHASPDETRVCDTGPDDAGINPTDRSRREAPSRPDGSAQLGKAAFCPTDDVIKVLRPAQVPGRVPPAEATLLQEAIHRNPGLHLDLRPVAAAALAFNYDTTIISPDNRTLYLWCVNNMSESVTQGYQIGVIFCLLYAAPLAFITACYGLVAAKLSRRTAQSRRSFLETVAGAQRAVFHGVGAAAGGAAQRAGEAAEHRAGDAAVAVLQGVAAAEGLRLAVLAAEDAEDGAARPAGVPGEHRALQAGMPRTQLYTGGLDWPSQTDASPGRLPTPMAPATKRDSDWEGGDGAERPQAGCSWRRLSVAKRFPSGNSRSPLGQPRWLRLLERLERSGSCHAGLRSEREIEREERRLELFKARSSSGLTAYGEQRLSEEQASVITDEDTFCLIDRLVSDLLMEEQEGSRRRDLDTEKYKTELCLNYSESGSCPYGPKCRFAHGKSELRSVVRHPLYRTVPCLAFSSGHCRLDFQVDLKVEGSGVERPQAGCSWRRLSVAKRFPSGNSRSPLDQPRCLRLLERLERSGSCHAGLRSISHIRGKIVRDVSCCLSKRLPTCDLWPRNSLLSALSFAAALPPLAEASRAAFGSALAMASADADPTGGSSDPDYAAASTDSSIDEDDLITAASRMRRHATDKQAVRERVDQSLQQEQQQQHPAAGLQEDIDSFLRAFSEAGVARFAAFGALFTQRGMAELCRGRGSVEELLDFSQCLFHLLALYSQPPYSTLLRIGALYLMYAYYVQLAPMVNTLIRLSLSQWQRLSELRQQLCQEGHCDALYCLRYLQLRGAFQLCAQPLPCYPSAPPPLCSAAEEARRRLAGDREPLRCLLGEERLETMRALLAQYVALKTPLAADAPALRVVDELATERVERACD